MMYLKQNWTHELVLKTYCLRHLLYPQENQKKIELLRTCTESYITRKACSTSTSTSNARTYTWITYIMILKPAIFITLDQIPNRNITSNKAKKKQNGSQTLPEIGISSYIVVDKRCVDRTWRKTAISPSEICSNGSLIGPAEDEPWCTKPEIISAWT